MLYKLNLSKILFIDIETVPDQADYSLLEEPFKTLWDKKAERIMNDEVDTPQSIYQRAGIYAEFGKIVCISVGFIREQDGVNHFYVKSYFGDDEKKLLVDFAELLNSSYNSPDNLLCGHNGKEFDFPYIARRMLINGIHLPLILDIAGRKPWEVNHLDTMELWKFGDYKNYTSLELLTAVFNIPTPKDDIKGSDVYKVYYKEQDLARIVTYCQKDVLTVAQLLLKYQGKPLIEQENVVEKN